MANSLGPAGLAVTKKALPLGLLLELRSWTNHVALTGRRVNGFDMELNEWKKQATGSVPED